MIVIYFFLSFRLFALYFIFFFFNDPATTEIYTLSLHDALPISVPHRQQVGAAPRALPGDEGRRSEEHTSELQSRENLVCRLRLEKKKQLMKIKKLHTITKKQTHKTYYSHYI